MKGIKTAAVSVIVSLDDDGDSLDASAAGADLLEKLSPEDAKKLVGTL